MTRSKWADFLLEAFPGWDQLPPTCLVRRVIQRNHKDEDEVVAVVTEAGARAGLLRRVVREHPPRGHLDEHDRRMADVFTEGEAFAWACEARDLGPPVFAASDRGPDLQVPASGSWVEAKSIWNSDADREAWRLAATEPDRVPGVTDIVLRTGQVAAPDPGLIRKFDSDHIAACSQLERSGDRLIVFFGMFALDAEVDDAAANEAIIDWAQSASRQRGTRIVVSRRRQWREPIVDTG